MTYEEVQRTVEFILQQQAQFAANVQSLQEERVRDIPRIIRLEESFQTLVNLAENTESRLDDVESEAKGFAGKIADHGANIFVLGASMAAHEANMFVLEANMGALAAAQTETDVQLRALAAGQTETDVQLRALAAGQTQTDVQLRELAAAQSQTDVQLRGLAAAQTETDKQINTLIDIVREQSDG